MTTRSKATVSHIVAIAGFFALMGAWAAQGGNSGKPTLAVAAFAWMLLIVLWQEIALRCPTCGRRIFAGQATTFTIPVKCARCGRAL